MNFAAISMVSPVVYPYKARVFDQVRCMDNSANTRNALVILGAGGTGFYCEFCAVRICSKCPQGNMQWKIKLAQPGMAAKKSRCWLGKCMGTGTFKGWNAVEAAARSRHAEHCRTCRAKLEEGAPLYAARPDPQPIPVLDLRKGSISSQPEYSNATKDSYSKTAGDGAGQDVVGGGSSSGFYQSGASADTAQLR